MKSRKEEIIKDDLEEGGSEDEMIVVKNMEGKGAEMDYDYNYSYMTGTCVTNHIYKDRDKVFDEYEHLIEIKLDFPRKELQGEYDNKLMFFFPHDDNLYSDVKVVEYK